MIVPGILEQLTRRSHVQMGQARRRLIARSLRIRSLPAQADVFERDKRYACISKTFASIFAAVPLKSLIAQ
jgi:hypothetical protein